MAVQKRNSEMVDLLRSDFVHKQDSAYNWAMLMNMYSMLPGITSFWSMGGYSKDDKFRMGTASYYDIVNNRLYLNPSLSPGDGTLTAGRGTGTNGTAVFQGTGIQSHFSYSTDEDTFIRGGKLASRVLINDANSGDIVLGPGAAKSIGSIGDGWKSFPFTNSGGTTWTNYGAGWQLCHYQKFGDLLMLRGLATRSAGTGIIIGNLPMGYRPANYQMMTTLSGDALSRIDVQSNGDVLVQFGYNGWIAIWGIYSLL